MQRIVARSPGSVKEEIAFCRAFVCKINSPLCFSPVRAKFNLLRQIPLCCEWPLDVRGMSKFCYLVFLKRLFQCFYM